MVVRHLSGLHQILGTDEGWEGIPFPETLPDVQVGDHKAQVRLARQADRYVVYEECAILTEQEPIVNPVPQE